MEILIAVVAIMCLIFTLVTSAVICAVAYVYIKRKTTEVESTLAKTEEQIAEEDRLAFRESQKAFEELMGYSVEMAYGIEPAKEVSHK